MLGILEELLWKTVLWTVKAGFEFRQHKEYIIVYSCPSKFPSANVGAAFFPKPMSDFFFFLLKFEIV